MQQNPALMQANFPFILSDIDIEGGTDIDIDIEGATDIDIDIDAGMISIHFLNFQFEGSTYADTNTDTDADTDSGTEYTFHSSSHNFVIVNFTTEFNNPNCF